MFINLLNNAVEAVGDQEDSWIRLTTAVDGDKVNVSVVDSGDALPPGLAEKLMEPFFTTKDAGLGRGTGLGLTISKKICESHGGELGLDTDSENASFVVTLPIAEMAGAED